MSCEASRIDNSLFSRLVSVSAGVEFRDKYEGSRRASSKVVAPLTCRPSPIKTIPCTRYRAS